MNNDFWMKTSKRVNNPSLKSTHLSYIFSQPFQQFANKDDKPIKIYERPNDFIKRSYSEMPRLILSQNPEKTPSVIQKNTGGDSASRMSNFGSSSLSRLPRLDSDIDVYTKQRKDREIDIISQEPKLYKDVIKAFPKYRQETLDQDYWRRRSFIEGKPTQALNRYSSNRYLEANTKLQSIKKLSTASVI